MIIGFAPAANPDESWFLSLHNFFNVFINQLRRSLIFVFPLVFVVTLLFTAAFEFFKSNPVDPIDMAAFEDFCGVGKVVFQEEIEQAVRVCVCVCLCCFSR